MTMLVISSPFPPLKSPSFPVGSLACLCSDDRSSTEEGLAEFAHSLIRVLRKLSFVEGGGEKEMGEGRKKKGRKGGRRKVGRKVGRKREQTKEKR